MTTITLSKKQLASLCHLLRFLEQDSDDEIIQSDLKIVSEVFKSTAKKPDNLPTPKYKIMTIEKYNMLMRFWKDHNCANCGREILTKDDYQQALSCDSGCFNAYCENCRDEFMITIEHDHDNVCRKCAVDCECGCYKRQMEEEAPKCIGIGGVACEFDADADVREPPIDDEFGKYWKQCKDCFDEEHNK